MRFKLFDYYINILLHCVNIIYDNPSKLGGVIDILEGGAHIQRNLEKVKEWANRNFKKFDSNRH